MVLIVNVLCIVIWRCDYNDDDYCCHCQYYIIIFLGDFGQRCVINIVTIAMWIYCYIFSRHLWPNVFKLLHVSGCNIEYLTAVDSILLLLLFTMMCDVWAAVCQPFVKRIYDDHVYTEAGCWLLHCAFVLLIQFSAVWHFRLFLTHWWLCLCRCCTSCLEQPSGGRAVIFVAAAVPVSSQVWAKHLSVSNFNKLVELVYLCYFYIYVQKVINETLDILITSQKQSIKYFNVFR